MNTNRILKIGIPIAALAGIYFLGPSPSTPAYDPGMPHVPSEAVALEKYISAHENRYKVKPDNEAKIVWNDSAHTTTEYAVVYLHGFSASEKEGDPVHRRFAKEFHCNLYLSRLSDHGIDTTEQLLQFTPDRAWTSAKEALAIGRRLGKKVILMSTSTGGTLALMLAAHYPDDVYALINLSPNIAINNPASFLLNNPWGLQIGRMVVGKYNESKDMSEARKKYWNSKYRMEAATQLQQLIEDNMIPETFKQVKQPSLTLYYYKNEEEQDPTVKVSAMLEMNNQLATPDNLKQTVAIPGAGAHVIGSPLTSKDVEGVYNAMVKFAIEKLKMNR